MQLEITGHHIDVTDSMNAYVREKVGRVTRHFDRVINIHVILEVQKGRHRAEASLHVSGNHIFAEAQADDMYSAIDLLADKLDRQIVKHKEKVKDHNRQQAVNLAATAD
ncbi:MAG: ribosome hibernation-promoting factor, HPF/YfiA family [Thiotrichaceae bacterium]|jgi:putative sigma-54 modulation protein|uniref:Ribosome hibernation promoting factor n=1 Tax=Candidatus Thiocaldithrix dubininis TaxID=3080823 RepID=A0AA95HB89_9GAMM|nr:MAG: ribosome-associated translation inhibitor RaiA [Candidatus Thiocaldithrix dubininis]